MNDEMIDHLEAELIEKRHILEEHLQGAMVLMDALERAADQAKEEIHQINPFKAPEQIRERQILHALVTQQLPRILENLMNAGDDQKVWRYKRELREP